MMAQDGACEATCHARKRAPDRVHHPWEEENPYPRLTSLNENNIFALHVLHVKTKKGMIEGADGRRSAATPKVKAAPFPVVGTGPVIICGGTTAAQSAVVVGKNP
jgi:hypothetical protein